jgi:hypothetical protein
MKRRQQVKKGVVEATSRKCATDIGCGIQEKENFKKERNEARDDNVK